MTKMHLIAKLTLTLLGIWVLSLFLDALGNPIYFRFTDSDVMWPDYMVWIVILLVYSGSVYWLLFRCDEMMLRMAGPSGEGENLVDPIWIAAGFRAIFILYGLLILVNEIEILVRVAAFLPTGPRVLVKMIVYKYIDGRFDKPFNYWAGAFGSFCKAVLGIYLISGAPRYVRWQMSRFCSATDQNRQLNISVTD